jgi:hypothetical protein
MFENEIKEGKLKETILERNSKEDVVDKLILYMKLVNAAESDMKAVKDYRLSAREIPFIPEDLGFKEYTQKQDGSPLIRVYHRDNVTCSKKLDGEWAVIKGKEKMSFKIQSKFHAYTIFTSMGVEFTHNDSTVPDMNQPISEIIAGTDEEE